MPASPELVTRHSTAMARLRSAAAAAVVARWDRLGSWDRADVDRFLGQVGPLVTSAQANALRLLAAYLSAAAGNRPTTIDPRPYTGPAVRSAATALDVWERPFVTTWAALRDGASFTDALAAGRERASTLAQTDVQLAMRNATRDALAADDRVAGYRRVLTGSSCAFCAAASTQRYRSEQLMPLHSRCDCTVAPIYGDSDPGRVINRRLLDDLRAQGPEFWKARHFTVDADGGLEIPQVRTVEAPELGPALEPVA